MQSGPQSGGEAARTLTDDLCLVLERANGRSMSVGALLHALHERGHAMLMIVLSLPFLVPVPLVGLSTPVGLVIALYGACLTIGVEPWIPGFLARREISYPVLEKVIGRATGAGRRIERWLKPRLKLMLWPGVDRLIGLGLIFLGLFLALPLPIPFTNSVPAVGLILLLLGLIERDGVCVILGQVVCVILIVVLYFLWGVVIEVFRKVGGMVGLSWVDTGATTLFAVLSPVI